ncbi:hypothetical protein NMY22_g431 [Coprinellus aureogranulatus]|nr:hypothetical protein NMY22_g431 [Coprinellus aureogranulatus]
MSPDDAEKPQTTPWADGYLQELERATPDAKLLEVIIPSSRIKLVSTEISEMTGSPLAVPKTIAAGGYADIYIATMTLDDGTENEKLASRFFRGAHLATSKETPELFKNRLRREYEVWGRLQHPNVQRLEGLVLTNLLPSPGLVSDYKPLGDLLNFAQKNLPFDRLAMALGIAYGLQYLHSEKVVHGDLTPTNILISQAEDGNTYIPLITDFGKARVDGQSGYTTNMNNSFFVAARPPELLGHNDSNPATNKEVLSFASDVYSLSMILLYVLTDIEPYTKEGGGLRLLGNILDERQPLRPCPQKYPLLDESHVFCWAIMQECWKPTPAERISSRKVYEHLCERSAPISSGPVVIN